LTSSPSFLITIDTEGDNLWSRPREITTENSRYLPRFQELCERNGLKPTYLLNYEMACCSQFQEFGRDVLRRGAAEIGMHLHAWNSPPIVPLTGNDYRYQPFLIEYADDVMRDKIVALTDILRETFGAQVTSHRAGRWAMDERYSQMLADAGYTVDCSVTPFVSWQHMTGNPAGGGGSDYCRFPTQPYFVDLADFARSGESNLLEVPMTIRPVARRGVARRLLRLAEASWSRLAKRVAARVFPPVNWLRPNGRNLRQMLSILDEASTNGCQHVEFMLHSSELMPSGSPRFRSERQVERLYGHLERLFARARESFHGCTLQQFRRRFGCRGSEAAWETTRTTTLDR